LSAITVVAIVGTLACLAALTTAIVAYLCEPVAHPITVQPSAPQPYSEHEIQKHAHMLVTQIERYLSRS
jgi:hypothetical protein